MGFSIFRNDKIKEKYIRVSLVVVNIKNKMRKPLLCWFGRETRWNGPDKKHLGVGGAGAAANRSGRRW